jgi:hypothetical protein
MTEWEKAEKLFWDRYKTDLHWYPFKEEDMKDLGMKADEFVDYVGKTYNLCTREKFMNELYEEE